MPIPVSDDVIFPRIRTEPDDNGGIPTEFELDESLDDGGIPTEFELDEPDQDQPQKPPLTMAFLDHVGKHGLASAVAAFGHELSEDQKSAIQALTDAESVDLPTVQSRVFGKT